MAHPSSEVSADPDLLVVGAGMAGLAAALACARRGLRVQVLEQASAFAEVGAGIQLGPNATRCLSAWGLQAELERVSVRPGSVRVCGATHGAELARMPLADAFERKYGAPYRTLHRADLHALLRLGAQAAGVPIELNQAVAAVQESVGGVEVQTERGHRFGGRVMLGADGVWSRLRSAVWGDAPAQPTGHLAYRGTVEQSRLPPKLRSVDVTVWLGRRLHAVSYPVRDGSLLNVVVVVEGRVNGDPRGWDHEAVATDLRRSIGSVVPMLQETLFAVPQWRLWPLADRPPVRAADDMARGRIALAGDAAHPMRPYFAQGACMAIEDAVRLAHELASDVGRADPARALAAYAAARWARCAKVQERSRHNGEIFHADGPVRWSRDLALRVAGARLLDQPWLYGYRETGL